VAEGTGVEATMGATMIGMRSPTGAGIGVVGWARAGDTVTDSAIGATLSSIIGTIRGRSNLIGTKGI
jgi:hypothetical protein